VACPKAFKAASVGANNVNGPAPDKVPSRPQVSIANSKVDYDLEKLQQHHKLNLLHKTRSIINNCR